jgi:hypothetical protein
MNVKANIFGTELPSEHMFTHLLQNSGCRYKLNFLTTLECDMSCSILGVTFPQKSMRMLIVAE